jgi:phosphohistidine phosphatase
LDLYLLRHGIAINAQETAPDGDRPLTDKGRKRMRKAARGLSRLNINFDAILTSPLTRAHETATIVAETLGRENCLSKVEALKPDGAVEELVSGLKDYNNCENLLLVGHEPLLSDTASFLLTGKKNANIKVALKKGGLVRIVVDSLPPRNPGTLDLLLVPKILRRLATHG